MGTPTFAVGPLRRLVDEGYHVVGVVTAPDKPAGRGHHLQPSPVKQYALSVGLPLLQPEKLRDPHFIRDLQALHADLQVVVAFRMLPQVVYAMPPHGTFNLHASLLPQYRGAAPINHALIHGETLTGVTTFFLDQHIDTGAIIRQVPVPINPTDNAGTLHDKLMHVGAQTVIDTIDDITRGTVVTQPQHIPDHITLHTAPKIYRDDCRINWNQSANAIHNLVRGLAPTPTAYTELDLTGNHQTQTVKIYATQPLPPANPHLPPGTLSTDGKTYLHIAANDGMVNILKLQLPGRKPLPTPELLRGLRIQPQNTPHT